MNMELTGKKINFLGDSITEGCCATSPEKGYVDVMKRKYRLTEARNYGIGGTRIARQRIPSGEPKFDQDFCGRFSEMNPDADIIVVFGGTNDFGHGDAPFGELSDTTDETFCGSLRVLYEKLINRCPAAQIVVLTPLHRLSENVTVNERGIPCKPLKAYVDAIRTIAEYYSLPVLDLWSVSGFQPHVDVIREKYMPDGLHPSDLGHAILARKIHNFIKTL